MDTARLDGRPPPAMKDELTPSASKSHVKHETISDDEDARIRGMHDEEEDDDEEHDLVVDELTEEDEEAIAQAELEGQMMGMKRETPGGGDIEMDGDFCSSTSSGVATEGSISPDGSGNGTSNSPSSGIASKGSSPSSAPTGASSQRQNPPEKRHVCDVCQKAFPYLSILESHRRCHTGEKPFSCRFCDKKFAQKATLQVHERTHTGERPYKCFFCDKRFAQYGTKTVHERSSHLRIRNYRCPVCEKCLSSPSALYTHKKTHGEKTFQCEHCPKTFTLKNYLKLHVKQVHQQTERKHICSYCSKSFAYAGSLQVHVRTHTGERPYVCRFCPKAFASQGNLQSHERTHTGERPYVCEHCGRSFIQKSQLTAHEATHTAEGAAADGITPSAEAMDADLAREAVADASAVQSQTPAKTPAGSAPPPPRSNDFECKQCGKRYAYASSLYVHIRQHTGERPFKCTHCDKTFTNQGNMQVHLRVHTGERPYVCSGCDKRYAQKVGLKIHQEQCQPFLQQSSAGRASVARPSGGGSSSSASSSSTLRHSASPSGAAADSPSDEDVAAARIAAAALGVSIGGAENVMIVGGEQRQLTSLLELKPPPAAISIPSAVDALLQQIPGIYSQLGCATSGGLPQSQPQRIAAPAPLAPPTPTWPPASSASIDFGAALSAAAAAAAVVANKPHLPGSIDGSQQQQQQTSFGLSESISSAFRAPLPPPPQRPDSSDFLMKGLLDNQLLTSLLLQQLAPQQPPPPPPAPSGLDATTLSLLQHLLSSQPGGASSLPAPLPAPLPSPQHHLSSPTASYFQLLLPPPPQSSAPPLALN